MPELAFCIEKNQSDSTNCFVLNIAFVERSGTTLTFKNTPNPLPLKLLQTQIQEKEIPLLTWLIQEELKFQRKQGISVTESSASFHTIHIPYAQSNQALKLLAPTNKLCFQQRPLVVNLFSKRELYYIVDNSAEALTVRSYIKDPQQDFELTSCDYICQGSPHWFVKGILLQMLHTDISWSELKQAYKDPSTLSLKELQENAKEDKEAPQLVFKGNSQAVMQHQASPLPILILADRTGAFAQLWMDYGNSCLPLHDVLAKKGQHTAELAWERDLLETAFIKKTVGSSHYYCPLDQVAKALTFLLELGWRLQDWQGNRIVRYTSSSLALSSTPQSIQVRGKITFETFETDLTYVSGAFNRKERFVQLGSGVTGLVPDHWETASLNQMMEEGELVSGSLQIPRRQIGTLADLFESPIPLKLDASLTDLKERLNSFQKIQTAQPGKKFRGELRPYQQEGLNWLNFLYDFSFHGILADDMGLGKTVQVLAFLSTLQKEAPHLIVVPTSLLFNWQREIEKFLPGTTVYLHHGQQRQKDATTLDSYDIILTSYTTLRLDLSLFSSHSFQCVILEEAQAIKNAHTQIAQAVSQLQARFRLSITGTPIENHLQELWAHFNFLMPGLFGNENTFLADLNAGASDKRYLQRIRRQIRPFILRRKKEEVAKDLPERIEQVVWVEMTPAQRQIYDSFLAGVRGNLFRKIDSDGVSKHRLEILEAILRLRQICCHPLLVSAQLDPSQLIESAKFDLLLEDIEVAIEEGRKMLVYSQFTSMLRLIAKALQERQVPYAYLDGSTVNREKVVESFQSDATIPVFLISLKAGGVGLNLTAADYVFLFDPWWNEAAENQAINRAHRIGRTDTVIAKRYVALESIEEKIMKLKESKRGLVDSLFTDELAHASLTEQDLLFLLGAIA
ncbi:MAG: DEAD/DEAH box helicase [Parachlamydiaceae bacterium]|nr:DEAD/DEAH box helicase [Parachlamydiaceae bacterium]